MSLCSDVTCFCATSTSALASSGLSVTLGDSVDSGAALVVSSVGMVIFPPFPPAVAVGSVPDAVVVVVVVVVEAESVGSSCLGGCRRKERVQVDLYIAPSYHK